MGYPKVPCIDCGMPINENRSGKCISCRKVRCRVPECGKMVTTNKRSLCHVHKQIRDLDEYLTRKNTHVDYLAIRNSVRGERV